MYRKEVLKLYKDLLRSTNKVPKSLKSYYIANIKGGFIAHKDEEDSERIKMILERSREDMNFIIEKYQRTETTK